MAVGGGAEAAVAEVGGEPAGVGVAGGVDEGGGWMQVMGEMEQEMER
jgi:hypothetical protein